MEVARLKIAGRFCVIALLCAIVLATAGRASAFTLEQILSTPFVDNLTASPDGTVLVWKVHVRGQRNLYTNAGGTVHEITNYDADDGLDIDNVQITPGNDAVVYLRGGTGDNAGGENINPRSTLPPPIRGVYLQSLGGGAPLEIGEASQVTLSPRGDALALIKGGTLQIVTLAKGASSYAASKPEPLAIRGQVQNPVWSPDGSRIAFTNTRNDHSFIVIYDPKGKQYVYATPDFSQDDFATWSPDGTRVAFVRTPGAREDESPYSIPSRAPWSIWVANAANGKAHMVWHARRGMGSEFYGSETSKSQLLWMRGDRIAFLWEGDGWEHLYAVAVSGGNAHVLTSGQFDVETIAQSLDRTTVFYATNQGDIDRRHIWRVGLDGHSRAVTGGRNDQWSPTPLARGGLAYVDAGYNAPPTITVEGTPPSRVVGVEPAADYPARELVEPKLITYRAPDGLVIHAQLFVPRTPGKHPAIVFDHGGPPRQMLPGFHYMEAYTTLYESNQYLVNRGFVVLSINYRSGIMYGHNFREAPHRGWFGASEYQDVLAGARWLQRQSNVDPARLGIYGLSYGGYLTALGLARNSDVFKAGSDYAGVHNWATLFDGPSGIPGSGRYVGTPAQRKLAYDSSPIASLDHWRSPVFLTQGDDDRNVEFSQGVDLATRLRDRGVHVETMVFPNETHENQVWEDTVKEYRASTEFLVRELRP